MRSRRPGRCWLPTVLLGLLLAVGGLVAPSGAGAAAPPKTPPVWVPLHSGFGLDCAGKNPGCTSRRSFFSIDVIPTGQYGRNAKTSHAKVYSMGGGVVHYGDTHGPKCGHGHSFGTWVWIDHGNNVKSRYGHLSKILVKNGAHVAAGTAIGEVGTTGKGSNCSVSYVDFEVEHGKLSNSNAHRVDTLRACTSGTTRIWPRQAATTKAPGNHKRVHFTTWNATPHGTQFPASSGSCIPKR
ncbi:M23 family metallopeptidase [Jatrophihabitans endophyticus]|uniref:M23 family metallopeptidase n=1 Tax=Jatrophihabitans endophyticus TaxID=1206085 RepID=UPI0019D890EE|nr:M23 family metallopeptidase [Jatrophihabitans endophyticus]MBE7189585.1 M23 family metallopeptidase [Jatrophihabitans endophyticus]